MSECKCVDIHKCENCERIDNMVTSQALYDLGLDFSINEFKNRIKYRGEWEFMKRVFLKDYFPSREVTSFINHIERYLYVGEKHGNSIPKDSWQILGKSTY